MKIMKFDYDELTIDEVIKLSNAFDIICDGDKKVLIVK